MITIKISPTNSELYDVQLMNSILQAICEQLRKSKFLFECTTGYHASVSGNEIIVKFKGVTTDEEAHDELNQYMFNSFNEILHKAGVRDVVFISGMGYSDQNGDSLMKKDNILVQDTKNSVLLSGLIPEAEIPERFRCSLTNQIMDSPVTTKDDPNKHYNKLHMRYNLFTKPVDQQVDPFTRKPVNPHKDIVKDKALKKEIDEFVRQKIQETATTRIQQLNATEAKYIQGRVTLDGMHSALRRCAAENDIDSAKVFMGHFILDLNTRDSNPNSYQTALHLAVRAGHVEMAKLLVEKGARTDVKDSYGKTPAIYAIEGGNKGIIGVVIGNVDLSKVVNAVSQFAKTM